MSNTESFKELVRRGQHTSSAIRRPYLALIEDSETETPLIDIKGNIPTAITGRAVASSVTVAFYVANDANETPSLLLTPSGVPYTATVHEDDTQVALDPRYLLGFRFVKLVSVTIDGTGAITGTAPVSGNTVLQLVCLP